MGKTEEITILLADDDDGHARLIQDLLKDAGVFNPLVRFRDGREAWDFVSGKSSPGFDPEKRYLLLLDIRMPGLDGVEVLERIKADEKLKRLNVIMLTTADDPKEVERCYALGCNAYLTKPVGFEGFSEVIKRLGLFILAVKVTPVARGEEGKI